MGDHRRRRHARVAHHPAGLCLHRLVVCPGHYAESVAVERAVRLEAFAGPSRTYLRGVLVTGSGARVAGLRLQALAVRAGLEVELLGNVVMDNSVYLPLVLKLRERDPS